MIKTIIVVAGIILTTNAKNNSGFIPSLNSDTVSKILIVNSFDAMSMKARKNKKELFGELADSLAQYLYQEVNKNGREAIVIPALLKDTTKIDSSIISLISLHNASGAIVIRSLNAFFENMDVIVEEDKDGKSKTAYFDICSSVIYQFYSKDKLERESEISTRDPFSSRPVISGLFAAGPDVVGKRKHVIKMMKENAGKYVRVVIDD